jgi:outer membrane protein OmpA-like peptidoglycan-associated protein
VPGDAEHHGCPAPKVQVTEKKLEINQMIYFEFGKARIEERSYPILDELVKVLAEHADIKIQIEGHTDNVRGPTFDNNTLSRKRAEAVKGYMVSHGVDAERLKTKGYGDKKPIAPNDTEEGRDKNRRVEFVIIKGK